MTQILTDIYEGYVMYSQMREYKYIRNFRFKKLKRYKIAKMKHQLHTLKDSGNYKPNLVVRVLTHLWETQKYLWGSVFYDSFKTVFKVGSSTNQQVERNYGGLDKLTTTTVRTPKVIFEEWLAIRTKGLRMKGITLNYTEQYGGAKTFEVSKGIHTHWRIMTDKVNDINKVDRFLDTLIDHLELSIAHDCIPKQPKKVEEPRKITHVKWLGKTWQYAIKDKVYKVTEHKAYKHCKSEYLHIEGERGYELCCEWRDENGDFPERCSSRYEIIYDNEIETSDKVMEEAYKHHRNQIQRLYRHGMKAHLERQQQNTIDILRSIKNFK